MIGQSSDRPGTADFDPVRQGRRNQEITDRVFTTQVAGCRMDGLQDAKKYCLKPAGRSERKNLHPEISPSIQSPKKFKIGSSWTDNKLFNAFVIIMLP
jgi:hypothetical protein